MKAGRFRQDLLYRLVVVTVRWPALRHRHGGIPTLARHFVDLHCEGYNRNVPGFRADAIGEPWRRHDNGVRPRGSLRYRTRAALKGSCMESISTRFEAATFTN